jgi:hypothetical protein
MSSRNAHLVMLWSDVTFTRDLVQIFKFIPLHIGVELSATDLELQPRKELSLSVSTNLQRQIFVIYIYRKITTIVMNVMPNMYLVQRCTNSGRQITVKNILCIGCIIFANRQYGICYMSTFWRLEFWDFSWSFAQFAQLCKISYHYDRLNVFLPCL